MAKKKEQGFTLVELLVAIVAASILLGAVLRLILLSQRTWLGAGSGSLRYNKAIASFEDLGAAIRSADAVVKSSSNSSQLVIITNEGSTVRFWFGGGNLWRQTDGEAGEIILGGLKTGSFAYWQENLGEQSIPPRGGGYSVLISANWAGGSLKTGFFVREWG